METVHLTMKSLSVSAVHILHEKPNFNNVFSVIMAAALFWAVFIGVFSPLLRRIVRDKPWFVAAAERDYRVQAKKMHEQLGVPKTLDEYIAHYYQMWPWFQLVATQHFVGGLLCVPAVFHVGGLDPVVSSNLACLAILSEVGWEVEDTIGWMYQRYFTKDGYQTVPFVFVVFLVFHHSLASFIGVPMVLYFGESSVLHWLCFDLQLAAGVGVAIGEYTKTLDVSKPSQLLQFQVLSFTALVIMVWTRGIHYFYLAFGIVQMLYTDKQWLMMAAAVVIGLSFTVFSWVICIVPYYRRFVKFINASARHQSLDDDVGVVERRQSMLNLEAAAAELANFQDDVLTEGLSGAFVTTSTPARRVTLPPNFYRSKRPSAILGATSLSELSRALNTVQSERHLIKRS